jgi:hypothetical protein
MLHFVAALQWPTRIPETLGQFSIDLISLDRFGSFGGISLTALIPYRQGLLPSVRAFVEHLAG